jgi:hypothetical protein
LTWINAGLRRHSRDPNADGIDTPDQLAQVPDGFVEYPSANRPIGPPSRRAE